MVFDCNELAAGLCDGFFDGVHVHWFDREWINDGDLMNRIG